MDAEARFRALFESHHAAVRRYAYHRAIRGADADDIVAETFTVAWRRLGDVPDDDPVPWLLAVAANVGRNQARAVRRYESALGRLPRPESSPPPAEPDDGDADLRRALDALPPDDREILRLVAWDGLTPQQAAVVLDCPGGTARARLHRARRRLARLLDEPRPAGRQAGTAPPQRPPTAGQFAGDGNDDLDGADR